MARRAAKKSPVAMALRSHDGPAGTAKIYGESQTFTDDVTVASIRRMCVYVFPIPPPPSIIYGHTIL